MGMTDKKKAINVLSNYKSHAFGDKDEKVTVEEIIALLKEQEPIQIIKVGYYDHGRCPKCDRYVSKYSNFCWYCGQAVKW